MSANYHLLIIIPEARLPEVNAQLRALNSQPTTDDPITARAIDDGGDRYGWCAWPVPRPTYERIGAIIQPIPDAYTMLLAPDETPAEMLEMFGLTSESTEE